MMKTRHLKNVLMCTVINILLMIILFTRPLSREIMNHNLIDLCIQEVH